MSNNIKNILMNDSFLFVEKEDRVIISRGITGTFDQKTVCKLDNLEVKNGLEAVFSSKVSSYAACESKLFELKDSYSHSFYENITHKFIQKNKKIIAGSASSSTFAILLDDGSVYLQDKNDSFGLGETEYMTKKFEKVKKIQISESYLLLLFKNRSVKLIKKWQKNQITFNKVKDISMSESHILFLSEDDKLFFMGNDTNKEVWTPKEINIPKGIEIKKIFAGEQKSFIINSAKEVYARGGNRFGELGIGNKSERIFEEAFHHLEYFSGIEDIISSHKYLTFFRTRMGKVYGCGNLKLIGEKVFSRTPKLIKFD